MKTESNVGDCFVEESQSKQKILNLAKGVSNNYTKNETTAATQPSALRLYKSRLVPVDLLD